MGTGQIGSGKDKGKKEYALNLLAKVQSTNSCSFCWFVVAVYPTLEAMNPRDESTYKLHLQKAHGLGKEIQP